MISEATRHLYHRERREAEGLKDVKSAVDSVARDTERCYEGQAEGQTRPARPEAQRKSYIVEAEREIREAFRYHPPNQAQAAAYEILRDDFVALAIRLAKMIPPSDQLELALEALSTAQMKANRAIALTTSGN